MTCEKAIVEEEEEETDSPAGAVPTLDEDVDTAIFVYHVAIENDPVHTEDTFHNVASIAQMQVIPTEETVEAVLATGGNPFKVVGADGTEDNVPFYRTSDVTLTFNNITEMEHSWRVMQMNVAMLSREYDDLKHLDTEESIEL